HAHAPTDLTDVEPWVRLPTLEEQAGGAVHVVPLRLVPTVTVEHLDAMVLAISHVDPALGIAADVVRDVELARIGAWRAPGQPQPAVDAELVHATVAVAIGDVDEVAVGRERGVRAAIERPTAHVGLRLARDPDGQQHLPLERAFAHGVIAVVGQPDRVTVGVHEHAVGPAKHAFAPRAQERSLTVEDDHG